MVSLRCVFHVIIMCVFVCACTRARACVCACMHAMVGSSQIDNAIPLCFFFTRINLSMDTEELMNFGIIMLKYRGCPFNMYK